jgi:uncharacterized damage-inducible protein DinB
LPAEPTTIAAVLDRTQIEWAALQDVVSRLSDAQLAAPGPEVWSVKDHLAHVAEWERACTAVLAHRPQWQGFGLTASGYEGLDIDALNAVLFERHRAAPVGEVKTMANAAHADMLTALAHLSDADLQRRVGEYGMSTNPDRKLLEKIAGDTYAHYAEHAVWIKELLQALVADDRTG